MRGGQFSNPLPWITITYVLNSIRGVETDDVRSNRSIRGKDICGLRQEQWVCAVTAVGTSRIESRAEGYKDKKHQNQIP